MRSVYLGVAALLAIAFVVTVWRVDAGDNRAPTLLAAQNEAGMASSQAPDADLHNAFLRALKSVEELRKNNRSTGVACTQLFSNFHRYTDIESYIQFFKGVGISPIFDDRNQRHYIAFQLDYRKFSSIGYKGFLRDDRLVIVFTTTSVSSTEITSFEVTLLNDRLK